MIPGFVTWNGKFHGETTTHATPHFRPGTNDRDVWQAAFVENEYGIPFFNEDDVVVDIGMHIGSFSCLAYMHGSRNVYGYEVDRTAYKLAVNNASAFSSSDIVPLNMAVVRSDPGAPKAVRYETGSMQTGFGDEVAVAIPFDIINAGEPIRFLKTDCEGSEFPILYTSDLSRVNEIAGEFHNNPQFLDIAGLPKCDMPTLAQFLTDTWGFHVQYEDKELGLFRAQRTTFGDYVERI